MKQEINEITVNGVEYVRKGTAPAPMSSRNGLDCVLVRTQSAGVHFGFAKQRTGKEIVLVDSRRVFYWDGAASLSQMATEGVKVPANCKFAVVLPSIVLTEAIEIIPLTSAAEKNLYAVPEWKR